MQRFYWLLLLCALWVRLFDVDVCCAQHIDSLRSVQSLDEIEVTGELVGGELRSSVPVQTMEQGDFERLGLVSVADVARRMAGVQLQDYGGIGGLKSVSVRGLGAKHTAVNYDGVAVTDAQSGIVDIGRFALDNVASLSLAVGHDDDIFRTARSYASAGVINVETRRPLQNILTAKGVAGSYGLWGASLVGAWVPCDRWSASACVNAQRADGDYPFTLVNGDLSSRERRSNGDVENITAEGNLFCNSGEWGTTAAKLYFYTCDRGLPGSVKFYTKGNYERLYERNSFVQLTHKMQAGDSWLLRGIAKYNYSYTRYIDRGGSYASGEQRDINKQNEGYLSLGAHYAPHRNYSFALTGDYTLAALENNFKDSKSPVRHNVQAVAAAQYDNALFKATASLLATYVTDKLQNTPSPADKKRLSPSLSFSWQPWRELPLSLRASFKDVYRIPTFADLYYLRLGNVGLKPERASQYNVGVTYAGEVGERLSFSLSADGYYNRVKDKIVALPTMYIWRMQNYGKVHIKGVDVTASVCVALPQAMELLLDASYSYSDAADKSKRTSANYGHQIPYTPRHAANASLSFNNRWVNISYLLTFAGERYMLPQNTRENRISPYTEHSLSLNRTFSLRGIAAVRLQGEFLNFTDVNYDIIRYYPMPGRQWRLSMYLTF